MPRRHIYILGCMVSVALGVSALALVKAPVGPLLFWTAIALCPLLNLALRRELEPEPVLLDESRSFSFTPAGHSEASLVGMGIPCGDEVCSCHHDR